MIGWVILVLVKLTHKKVLFLVKMMKHTQSHVEGALYAGMKS